MLHAKKYSMYRDLNSSSDRPVLCGPSLGTLEERWIISSLANVGGYRYLDFQPARSTPKIRAYIRLILSDRIPSFVILCFYPIIIIKIINIPYYHIMPPVLGLRQASANPSFLSILRSLVFTYPVPQELLTSSTFKLLNPRNHVIVTDQVSIRLPASSISGLSDEAVLALFTRGFFGGKVFAIERLYMKLGGWRIIPRGYTGRLLAS